MSAALRARIVAEAMRWVGTPYHHHAAVLGAGIDCGQLLVQVFAAAGVIAPFETGAYSHDWHLHRGDERYLERVEAHADEIAPGAERPGDVVVYRFGRCYSHGGIVLNERELIHAYVGRGCCVGERAEFAERSPRYFCAVDRHGR